ncbi:MAG: hypothetical protein AABX07_05475 [Nanoarchaeota archaeon]
MEVKIGQKNISFGWLWILIGLIVGAFMGMFAFNGPLPSPVGDYTSLPRRMLRLSHIAFIALAIINILYGYEIDKIRLMEKTKKSGSWFILIGAILMPIFLIIAVFFEPVKYLTMIPTALIIISIFIMVAGEFKKRI